MCVVQRTNQSTSYRSTDVPSCCWCTVHCWSRCAECYTQLQIRSILTICHVWVELCVGMTANSANQGENCEKNNWGGLANMSPLQSFPSPSPSKIVVGNASQTPIKLLQLLQNTWHRQTITFASCYDISNYDFYTLQPKSVKYTIPYIYLHLSLLGVMPDPLGYFKEH